MNQQYRAINHCIQLLRQSKVPELKKQQVEFQMVQLKRLLQEELPDEVTSGPGRVDVFDSLVVEMGRISRGEGKQNAMDDLLSRLGDLRASVFQTLKEHANRRHD